MGQQAPIGESKRFGQYLRRIRQERKLSLDAVEELSVGYPGRVTKSHLSRIETGQAVPTFPRMFALSEIYGVPISSMAERFELDVRRGMVTSLMEDLPEKEALRQASRFRRSGRHVEALVLYDGVIERKTLAGAADPGTIAALRLERVNCLVQLSRFCSAKEECENLLGAEGLTRKQSVIALQLFATCCYQPHCWAPSRCPSARTSRNIPRPREARPSTLITATRSPIPTGGSKTTRAIPRTWRAGSSPRTM